MGGKYAYASRRKETSQFCVVDWVEVPVRMPGQPRKVQALPGMKSVAKPIVPHRIGSTNGPGLIDGREHNPKMALRYLP
jgi:hypothetical protein